MADDDYILGPPAVQAEIVPAKPLPRAMQKQVDGIRAIEDKIYAESMDLLTAALKASDIDGNETEPPEEWLETMDKKAAKKTLRAAKDIRLPASVRPGHIALAQQLVAGIAKAREGRGISVQGPLQINVLVSREQAQYLEVIDEGEDT